MMPRTIGLSVVMAGCALVLLGGIASAEDEPPLPSVLPEYADKHMPAGGWTDPKAIEEGALIYIGEANPQINCASCHGKDGKPVKKGARDLREPKNTTPYSDSFWFWRVSEGVPKTKMNAWKGMLSDQQIWQVIAYQHQFSHDGKPSEHNDYKP